MKPSAAACEAFGEFDYPVFIHERHLDTFGHVNNAAYLEIFEEARWHWITTNGFGLKEIRSRGVGPVILEVAMRFHRELGNRENVIVRSRCLDYRGKVARMEQSMLRDDGKVFCRAEFKFGLFDLKTRRLIDPTPEWIAALRGSA
ncbi:MAG: acyl-CoA thioesterase [Elusimicrobiota bacterium]